MPRPRAGPTHELALELLEEVDALLVVGQALLDKGHVVDRLGARVRGGRQVAALVVAVGMAVTSPGREGGLAGTGRGGMRC